MNLTDISEIRALLSQNGFRFSKSMGQNFLIADWVPERIAEESGVSPANCVLEIGPGVGCLTEKLSARAGRVVAVELDSRLIPLLKKTLAGCKNVEVINADVMKLDLAGLVRERFSPLEPAVCANLPYNITTPVLTKLIESELFSSVTVMVQREVAERICAAAGTADYGAFTLLVQYYTEPEMLFRVPASCFEPRPKVESAVIRLTRRAAPPVGCGKELLFRIIRAAFSQRRKTLSNALASGFPSLNKQQISESIESAGLSPSIRGESLTLAAFAAITDQFEKILP